MRPSADLLGRLGGLRLLGNAPGRSFRQGERRSSAKGAGLEFAGHRAYQEGDDLRHLDTRLYARLRQPFVREYLADRQLRVSILIDASASMDFGDPSKRSVARMLAGLLAYAGLSSGDLVDVGIAQDNRVNWSDAMQGAPRADNLFRWINEERPEGRMPFAEQLKTAVPRLRAANVAIIISDWWLEDAEQDMKCLAGLPGQVYAIQVTTPEEEDPMLVGRGSLRLADAETGAWLDCVIDPTGAREYAQLLEKHRQGLQALLKCRGGYFLSARTDMADGELLAALKRGGLLG